MFRKANRVSGAAAKNEPLHCSFCNKSQTEVRKLIAGPAAFICNECVEICNEIMTDDPRLAVREFEPPAVQREHGSVSPTLSVTIRCALCTLPLFSSESVVIENRGPLCPGCVDAVEAAIAARNQGQE